MSAEYFEEQRRQLIAAIRANTDQVAAQIGKAALDKRVSVQCQGPTARICWLRPSHTLT